MTTFFDRYALQMEKLKTDPCSQKAADMFGVTRAALSSWNKKHTTPKGDTVARIADGLGVSADYLLGRTDDTTDWTKATPATILEFGSRREPGIMKLYRKLDASDRLKAEGVLQGMLMQAKYTEQLNAAHSIPNADPGDVANDDSIMDSADF